MPANAIPPAWRRHPHILTYGLRITEFAFLLFLLAARLYACFAK
jgi:hypothetical protein